MYSLPVADESPSKRWYSPVRQPNCEPQSLVCEPDEVPEKYMVPSPSLSMMADTYATDLGTSKKNSWLPEEVPAT